MTLPAAFRDTPLAHRALHDRNAGRVENSRKSIQAAIDASYGIEVDVQLSRDGEAMVFHDDLLDRLTAETGPITLRGHRELGQIALKDDGGTIPTLSEVLAMVSGQVPLLIEIKDQTGTMGGDTGVLEQATVNALQNYKGDIALMSFNPHAVAVLAKIAPDIPRGLTTSAYAEPFWPDVPAETRDALREIPDYYRVGACFISHEASDLARPRISELRAEGAAILCWTIRSRIAEAEARQIADNITFEGYLA